jgi:hypothetical protein
MAAPIERLPGVVANSSTAGVVSMEMAMEAGFD